MATANNSIADDLLNGASEISEFFYGDASEPNRKRVYHLVDTGVFPAFKVGGVLHARRSTIVAYIEALERAAVSRFPNKGKAA
jgi:hypothetical protein